MPSHRGDVAASLGEVGRRARREPTVAEASGAAQRRRRGAADPDRQPPCGGLGSIAIAFIG
jgi:hypothetical protein